MKRLLLLLVSCVSLASCSETLDAEEKRLEEIKKRFDFSEVDVENIQDIQEEKKFNTPELTVFTGTLDDCAWIGVFDAESGDLKCQYTDEDHPTSYFAYGEEYKYKIGRVCGVCSWNGQTEFLIQYDCQYTNIIRWDLITTDGNKHYRYVIDEDTRLKSAVIMKWANNAVCIALSDNSPAGDRKVIIYDIDNKSVMCCLEGDPDLIRRN